MLQPTRQRVVLYLVRHGETVANHRGKTFSHFEEALTLQGRQQAIQLGQHFLRYGAQIDWLISSKMPRAMQTCELIRERLGMSMSSVFDPDARFNEISRGKWEGKRYRDVIFDPDQQREFLVDLDFAPPEGESLRDAGERMVNGITSLVDLLDSSGGGTVCIFTHQQVIRALRATNPVSDMTVSWRQSIGNTGVTVFECLAGDCWRERVFNGLGHLESSSIHQSV